MISLGRGVDVASDWLVALLCVIAVIMTADNDSCLDDDLADE